MLIYQDFAVGHDLTPSLLAAFEMSSDGFAWGMSQFTTSTGTVETLGRFIIGKSTEFLWEVIINSEVILEGKVQAANGCPPNGYFKVYFFTLIIILLGFPWDLLCWTPSIANMVLGNMCYQHFCYDKNTNV